MAADASAKYKILVVDDNIDAAEVLGMLLGSLGHDPVIANTGTAALECALQAPPQLVLLDLALPDISGFEVARRLRQLPGLAGVRLIALSGFSGEQHRDRCTAAGFDAYVEKPIDIARLEELLSR